MRAVPPEERPFDSLTPQEKAQRIDLNSCVSLRQLKAVILALIAKGVITQADIDAATPPKV